MQHERKQRALAEFERDIILERTQAGLRAARARGRKGGRPRLSGTSRKIELARKLYDERRTPINDICRGLNISRATLYGVTTRKCSQCTTSGTLTELSP